MGANIELYEALKPRLGDEGARLIAEAMPAASEVATKTDLEAVRQAVHQEIDGVRQELSHEMRLGFADLKREIAESKADMRGWMLWFFVPLWIGVYGTLGALVVSTVVQGG